MIRVADYIFKFLADHGVVDMFTLTGYGAMYLNDGMVKEKRIRYYCVRNEAAAPMMAESYARITGIPAAVCVTSGPGAINAVPGVSEAWVDAAPIIVISGQVPLAHTVRHAGIKGLRTLGNAEIDIVAVAAPITKYAHMVDEPQSIRYHMEKAYWLAMNGRPGPVWLDIPMDVQAAEVDPDSMTGFTPPSLVVESPADLERSVNEVFELFMRAKKPLIVGGQGIRQSHAISEFKTLVDTCNAPVVFSRLGLDAMPFSHPLNMGLGGIKGQKYSKAVMGGADFVLAIGSRLALPFIGLEAQGFAKDAVVAVVDIEVAELAKPGARISCAIRADAGAFIRAFLQKIRKEGAAFPEGDWARSCMAMKKAHPMVTKEQESDPIDLYHFMARLDAVSDAKKLFITDAGSNYYIGGQVFRFEYGEREVTSGAFASMGLSIPLAIGAAVAAPDKQVLAVTGDGSLELNVQELKTMSYYNLDIKLFVINNGGYVSMRNWQDSFFEGRRIGSDDATGIGFLNLKNVANAFDLRHEIISSAADIDGSLRRIMAIKGPVFVEVICDNNQKIAEPIDYAALAAKAKRIRRDALEATVAAGKGHLGGTYSCVDVLTALYYGDYVRQGRDKLILSKGHACLAIFSIFKDLGIMSAEQFASYGADGGLGGQLDTSIAGVDFNTGSLGHAIGVGAGMAFAMKAENKKGRVFAVVGDAEFFEGSMWEGMMFAAEHRLENLTVIIDRNKLSVTAALEDDGVFRNFKEKAANFEWDFEEVDGHDLQEVMRVLEKVKTGSRPSMIVAHTVKGKGVSFMENNMKWHHGAPSAEETELARKELQ